MGIFNMFGLAGIQPQVFYAVVTWILVYVMHNFMRQQIAANVLLHDKAMLKDVFQAGRV